MIDPALTTMFREMGRKTKLPNAVAVAAAKDILDRAGLSAQQAAAAVNVVNVGTLVIQDLCDT